MASVAPGVKPSQAARQLAESMLADRETMRTILDETVPHEGTERIHESGRTVCQEGDTSNIKSPLARFPTSVELSQCPRGARGGTWHTHVTKEELRNPNNSLPDTANVMFGDIDVSVVVGTQTAEVVMAPENGRRGRDEFRNALGADVQSPEDVVNAIISGRVGNPADARDRVRSQMSALFDRRQTNFTDIDQRISHNSIPAKSPTSMEMHEANFYSQFYSHHDEDQQAVANPKNPIRDPVAVKSHIKGQKEAVKETRVVQIVTNTAVSEAVSTAVRSLF